MFRTLATLGGIVLAINVIEQMVCGKSNPAIPNNSDKSIPVGAGKPLSTDDTSDSQVALVKLQDKDSNLVSPVKPIGDKDRPQYEIAKRKAKKPPNRNNFS